MSEQWTCTRCSTENPSWAISCSGCGTLRADLSVAGAGTEAAGPAGAAPESPSVAAADPTIAPSEPKTPPASPAAPPWGGTIASSDLLRDRSTSQPPALGVETPPAPPPTVPFWKRIPLGVVITFGLIGIGAIGGLIFNASRSDSGEINKSGNLEVTDLRVGDCFDLKDPSAEEIGEVTALPCTAEHEFEMYFIGSMPDGAFPSDDGFNAWLDENCLPAFGDYVGKSYDDSELEVFWLAPSQAGWNDGDRSIQCALSHPRIHRLTESLKGSAQ